MITTRITELLGIKYPVLQGGMVHIATCELASAVSNAGGLGTIGCGNYPATWVREQIMKMRELTNRPFAVNILLISPHVKDVLKVAVELKPKIVTLGAGIPRHELPMLKNAGIMVIPVVGSTKFASLVERLGADAVIAEGMESGGEIGDMSTMPLVPLVVDAVSIPVIAAGGIADGRGLLAALSLGAEAVQMGTRFVASKECTAHENMKQAIVRAVDRSTAITGAAIGNAVRSLPNKLTSGFKQLEVEYLCSDEKEKDAKRKKLIEFGMGATRKGLVEGDTEYGSMLAGQISSLIKEIKPVKNIIEDIMQQAEQIIKNKISGWA